ncbi:hypothetical protein [Pseudooceanicola sp. LIPI14-2-Ac024]|uniref:hypothetical protein n=1 Tax=Pseudooceanicola sp. LIPI14-2-Ac024 TaxID=3344875 RepID=UPI0035CF6BAD
MIYRLCAYLLSNAAGLFVAVLILPGFSIDWLSFILVVAIFSGAQTLLDPLITKMALTTIPQLRGGVALITIGICLLLVDLVMQSMNMGGVANWLAATLLVWLGSMIAAILLPLYVFKELVVEPRRN